jgi:predicted site-specific integrase-resolvase
MKEHDDRRPRLSTAEVVELFEVSKATLYRWIREGKLPEPARDPESGWPVWQQPDLDALAKVMNQRKMKRKEQ